MPDGVGFKLESGSLGIAMIKPAGVGDTRSWTAVTAKITNGSLRRPRRRLPGDGREPRRRDQPRHRHPDALNWTTALATPVVIPGQDPIAYTEEQFAASGRFLVNIFGFVSGDVGFRFETSKVNLTAPALTGATLTRISLTVNELFVGVPDGPGFRVTGGQLVGRDDQARAPAPARPTRAAGWR